MVKIRYFDVLIVIVAGDNAYESVSRSKALQNVSLFPLKIM